MEKIKQVGASLLMISSILLFQVGCKNSIKSNQEEQSNNLNGAWWYVDSDSTYAEAFIRNDSIWTFTQAGGVGLMKFKFVHDTLEFSTLSGKTLVSLNVKFVDTNKFILEKGASQLPYQRLDIKVDPEKLFRHQKSHSEYVASFFKRTEKWYNENKDRLNY